MRITKKMLGRLQVKPQATQIRTTIAKKLSYYISEDEKKDGLEFGAGLCHGAQELGLESYEPFPKKNVQPTYTKLSQIKKRFSFILCTYVLNVVPEETRIEILKSIKRLLKPNGGAILVVRGVDDFGHQKNKVMSVGSSEFIMKKGNALTYQHGFTLDELLELCGKCGFIANKIGGTTKKSIRVRIGVDKPR